MLSLRVARKVIAGTSAAATAAVQLQTGIRNAITVDDDRFAARLIVVGLFAHGFGGTALLTYVDVGLFASRRLFEFGLLCRLVELCGGSQNVRETGTERKVLEFS